jgi:hypothetical protein
MQRRARPHRPSRKDGSRRYKFAFRRTHNLPSRQSKRCFPEIALAGLPDDACKPLPGVYQLGNAGECRTIRRPVFRVCGRYRRHQHAADTRQSNRKRCAAHVGNSTVTRSLWRRIRRNACSCLPLSTDRSFRKRALAMCAEDRACHPDTLQTCCPECGFSEHAIVGSPVISRGSFASNCHMGAQFAQYAQGVSDSGVGKEDVLQVPL